MIMGKRHAMALCLGAACALWGSGLAATGVSWDRAAALAATGAVDRSPVRRTLLDLTVSGSTVELLDLLTATSTRADWPLPAREATLYEYTQELRSLPTGMVPRVVMTWLKNYQPQTLVPHEDHAGASLPLYNVRGAATGVENVWLRQAALLEGLALLAANPRSLVDVFLIETHPAARGGYLDTLAQATPEQLRGVGKSAIRRLRGRTELTPLAGQASLLAGDLDMLAAVFARGGGPALAPLMRESATRLAPAAAASLMSQAIENAPAGNAALAIAELGGIAAGDAGIQALLIEQLADPVLGSPAAMALARHGTPATLQTLQALAASGPPLVASRATLALEQSRQVHREPR